MSKTTVKSLATKWTFDVDTTPLKNLDKFIMSLQKRLKASDSVLSKFAKAVSLANSSALKKNASIKKLSTTLNTNNLKVAEAIKKYKELARIKKMSEEKRPNRPDGPNNPNISQQISQTDRLRDGLQKGIIAVGTLKMAFIGLNTFVSSIAFKLENYSKKLGFTADSLQSLAFSARQFGVENEQLFDSIEAMAVRSADAFKNPDSDVAEAFKNLGVSVNENGKVKDAQKLFLEIADSIAKIDDNALKLHYIDEIFEGQGIALKSMLELGSTGIANLQSEFVAIGGGIDKELIEKSKSYHKILDKSMTAVKGVFFELAKKILPVMTASLEGFFKSIKKNKKDLVEFFNSIFENTERLYKYISAGFETLVFYVRLIGKLFGGVGEMITFSTKALLAFIGIKILSGLGSVALGITKVTKAFTNLAKANLLLTLSGGLKKILVGGVVAGVGLLIHDIVVYLNDGNSVIGQIINKVKKEYPYLYKVLNFVKDTIKDIVGELKKLAVGGPIEYLKDLFSGVRENQLKLKFAKLSEKLGPNFNAENFDLFLKNPKGLGVFEKVTNATKQVNLSPVLKIENINISSEGTPENLAYQIEKALSLYQDKFDEQISNMIRDYK